MPEQPILFAYVDPGAGSMILQLVLGGAAGLIIAVKAWWRRLRPKDPAAPDEDRRA
jgi:hypothetical protein